MSRLSLSEMRVRRGVPQSDSTVRTRRWLLLGAALLVVASSVWIRSTADTDPAAESHPPVVLARGAVDASRSAPSLPSPGQGDDLNFSQSDLVMRDLVAGAVSGSPGAVNDLANKLMDLIRGVTATLQASLPDIDKSLDTLQKYVEQQQTLAEYLGSALHIRLEGASKKTRKRFKATMRKRFTAEVEAYELAIARFELNASDEQLVQLNALLKALVDPIHKTE